MKLPKQCPKCNLRRFRETNKKIICEDCGYTMWKSPYKKAKKLSQSPPSCSGFSKNGITPNVFPKGATSHQKEMIRNKPELPRDEYQEWGMALPENEPEAYLTKEEIELKLNKIDIMEKEIKKLKIEMRIANKRINNIYLMMEKKK